MTGSVLAATRVPSLGCCVQRAGRSLDYFRCPAAAGDAREPGRTCLPRRVTSRSTALFVTGARLVSHPPMHVTEPLPDVSHATEHWSGSARLPFDLVGGRRPTCGRSDIASARTTRSNA